MYSAAHAQNWQPAGPADNSQDLLSTGTANYTDVAMYNSIPYVVYSDGSNGSKATVKKLSADGRKWETVGNAGFSTGTVAYTKIAFNGATPYVVFQDNGTKATVMKLNTAGTAWEVVGNANFSAGTVTYTDIAFAGEVPYVVYSDGANGSKATVMTLNTGTSTWEPYGNAAFSAGTAAYTCITILNAKPYIAYQDSGSKATVMTNPGTGWVNVANSSFSSGVATYLAITNDGTKPYVSLKNGTSSIIVMTPNTAGTTWQTYGGSINSSQATATDLVISAGTFYLLYTGTTQKFVAKSTGGSFQTLSISSFTSEAVNTPSLALIGTNPMVVYHNGTRAAAQRYNGAQWQSVAGPGFGPGTSTYLSMTFNGGVPYAAFLSNGAKVYSYDGSNWNAFPGLNGWTGEWPVIDFENSQPYLGLQGQESVVLTSTNGTTWTYVPSGVGTRTSVYSPTLKLNDGSQYVAFVDISTSRKLTVLKSTGTSWVALGGKGFSTGEPAGHKLFFIGNTPYIGYIDIGINSNRPLVKKWNGTSWEAVGDASIASADMVNPTFASDGTSLYTAYGEKSADGTTYKATLLKFNGSTWEPIGPRQFSAGTAYPTSIAFVGTTPYVAFVDLANGEKATVMRYNGTSWELVGAAGFSVNKVSYLNFGYDGNNRLYASYNSNNVPYAQYFSLLPPVSTNAALSGLTLSNGTLSPVFDGAVTSYSSTVASTIASLTITPTVADATATVQVKVNTGNYTALTSGTASAALALNYGSNTLTVLVTAQDGTTTKTYTLTVNRDLPPPAVVSVTSTTADGSYHIGNQLSLQVTFDRAVIVTGNPTLTLNAGGTAVYASGSGTTTLNFNYTVAAGEQSADLNYAALNSLALAGGSIKDAGNTMDAVLTLPVLTDPAALAQSSDLVIDGIVPTITATAITSNNTNPILAKAGDRITLTFTGSEALLTPTVTILGAAATVTHTGNVYTATYTASATDLEGNVEFTVNYQDLAGNNGLTVSTTSNNSSVLYDRTAPLLPTDFTAIGTDGKVVLNWAANNETDLNSYNIYGGTTANPTAVLAQVNPPDNSYTAIGLVNGTTMYFILSAVDQAGNESILTATVSSTAKAAQTITFNPFVATVYGTADFDPQAASSNNLLLTYTSGNPDVATIVAGKIHLNKIGTTTITATQTGDNANEAAANQSQQLVVTAKPITVSLNATPLITKVYNQSATATLVADHYTLNGLVNNDAVNITGTASYDDAFAGLGKTVTATNFVLTGAQKDNYTLTTTTVSTTGTIFKQELVVTADNKSRYQGTPNPVFSVQYNGFVNGESQAGLSTLPLASTTANTQSVPGQYPIIPAGGIAQNYTFNYIAGTLEVLPAIQINQAPTIDAIADATRCFSSAKQTIEIGGITAGPDAGQSTTLQISSTNNSLFDLLEVTTPTANGNAEINYRLKNGASGAAVITLTVTDNGGTANGGINSTRTSFNLRIDALAEVTITSDQGTSISKGETVVLTASGGSTYQWANASGIISGQNAATLNIRPAQQTTYTVSVTNANGCSAQKEITISVKDNYDVIKGANILTPNGDGTNDKFVIKNIDLYPNNEVKIFDKAGRLLYSKKSYDNQWDGTVSGSALAEGTYYYIIDFGPGLAKKKGFITIIRD